MTLEAQKQKSSLILRVVIVLVALSLALTGGVVAWRVFLSPASNRIEMLSVDQITLGTCTSLETAVFKVSNLGASDVTVTQAQAQVAGNTSKVTTSQVSGSFIPKHGSTNLTASFQGISWRGGDTYNFTLITSHGHGFPTQNSTFPMVEQMRITQTIFNNDSRVTFTVISGTLALTVCTVFTYGNGISGQASGVIASGSYVPGNSTSTIVVDFPSVIFQSGSRYDFILQSKAGNRFPVSIIR